VCSVRPLTENSFVSERARPNYRVCYNIQEALTSSKRYSKSIQRWNVGSLAVNVLSHAHAGAVKGRLVSTGLALVGWILLLTGLGYLIAELLSAYMTGSYRMISAGQAWFDLNVASLNLVQAVIQRYIHPFLWDPIIAGVLRWPVWSLLGGIGAFLVIASPLKGGR